MSSDNLLSDMEVFNGTKKNLLDKKNNIWLGVSISLKPYSEKLAKEYLKLISKYTKEKALVFIADEISSVNYNVLEKYSPETSVKKALEKGDTFIDNYKKFIKTLPKNVQSKIVLVRWKDVWNDKYNLMYNILKKEFETNKEFRKEVEAPIRMYLKNSGRTIEGSRIAKLSEYILKELPSLLDGVEYDGQIYKTFVYPTYGKTSLSLLSTQIQRGERFPELKKKLKIKGDNILIDFPIPKS